jgi:hypothetical protein
MSAPRLFEVIVDCEDISRIPAVLANHQSHGHIWPGYKGLRHEPQPKDSFRWQLKNGTGSKLQIDEVWSWEALSEKLPQSQIAIIRQHSQAQGCLLCSVA